MLTSGVEVGAGLPASALPTPPPTIKTVGALEVVEVSRLEKLLLFVAKEEKVEDERKRVDDVLVVLEK